MKRFKRFDKRFFPMLWIGLGIWAVAMAVNAILESKGLIHGQETLMDMGKTLFQRMPFATLLLLCLLQPVFEEVSFRLWGVGKQWMTIVCLVFMSLFGFSEMGLWMIFFLGGFLFVWLRVKDRFRQLWLNALITSLCFALCHISGFGTFGIGMVLGLLDIFGMALVMCWLTINLSFWFSCLLHVLNNSLAIILPLLLVPDPVTNSYAFDEELDNGTHFSVKFSTDLRHLDAFADNDQLLEIAALSDYTDEQGIIFVGEPAEIAAQLLSDSKIFDTDFSAGIYYDWISRSESMEDRIVYRVNYEEDQPTIHQILECFLKDYEALSEKPLRFDTTEAELQNIDLVYIQDDSRVNINSEEAENDFSDAITGVTTGMMGRTTRLFVPYAGENDTVFYYALPSTRPESVMAKYDQFSTLAKGFQLEYTPTGKKVKLITIR